MVDSDGSGVGGAPPPPVPTPPPYWTIPASPPSKPRSGRGPLLAAAAVVIAVVAVLAGLYLGGVGPFARPSPSSHGANGPESFSAAWKVSNQTAASEGSGPWSTYYAGGIALAASLQVNTSLLLPTDLFSEIGACTGVDLLTNGTLPLLPAFSGNLSSGEAPAWVFFTGSADAGTLLLVGVVGGQGTVWEEFTGTECATIASLAGVLPGDTVSSEAAIGATMSAGGAAFVADHPGGSLLYLVEAEILGTGGYWGLDYTTCPTSGAPVEGATYYELNATVGLTNGTLVGPLQEGDVSCAAVSIAGGLGAFDAARPLDSALKIGAASAPSGTEWLVPVESATPGLVIDNLVLDVVTPSGGSVSILDVPTVELLAPSGCGLAEGTPGVGYYVTPYSGACSTGTTGGDAPVQTGDSFELTSTGLGEVSGDTLEISGQIGYSGSVTAVL